VTFLSSPYFSHLAFFIADIVGDALLILLPFWLVYRTKLNRAQKIRIIAIFSTTILITAFALYHAAWVFKGGFEEAFAATLQVRDAVTAS